MATFTVTTGTSAAPADYATLGTRATADVYNINGGYLRVDCDSRYGVGGAAAASFGNIVPSATLGGSIEFNSTKVRLIPYASGSGNVPAMDTAITQGSASGKLIAVYSALNATPTATGAGMPASGYIKIRQWNSVSYAASQALGGLTATTSAVDGPGWIECVGVDASTATINRLNSFIVRGDWYTFQDTTTTNTRTTGYQIPSNGSGVNYFPGVWVQSAIATVTAASWAGGVATYTAAAHGFKIGQDLTVTTSTPAGYNAADVEISAVTTNTFSIPLVTNPGAWTSGSLAYVYEDYPCQGTLASTITNMATDSIRGRFCWIVPATGLIYFGYDGTNNTGGYCPPSGRKIRIPNIFFVCCVAAASVNVLPNATLTTRYKFSTTLAGVIDIDKCCMNWQATFQQPFSVALKNTAIMTQLTVSEIASPIAWEYVIVGQEAANTQTGFSMILCTAGGTMKNCTWTRATIGNGLSWSVMTDVTGLTILNERACSILLRTHASTQGYTLTRVGTTTWINTIFGNGVCVMSTCNDIEFRTTTYYGDPGGALEVTTAVNYPMYVWSLLLSCVRIKLDGLDFGGLRLVQPYSGVLNIGLAGNSAIKLRNLGTAANPLDMGGDKVDGTFTQATTVVTCTKTAHGLKVGDIIYVYSLTAGGTFTVGSWALASVTNVNVFTITRTTGTAASPLPFSYYPTMTAQLVNIVAAHDGSDIKIQRCYTPHLRTNLIVQGDNSNKGVVLESVVGDYINAPTSININQTMKQLTCTHPLAVQNSVYGTHWLDQYTTGGDIATGKGWTQVTTTATVTSVAHGLRTGDLINVYVSDNQSKVVLGQKSITVLTSDTFTFACITGSSTGTISYKPLHGRICIQMNESTSDTTAQAVLTNGAGFTSSGGLSMPTTGHQAVFTTPVNIIGHTGFPIAEAVMATVAGGAITNYDTSYSLDGGSNYSNLALSRFVTPLTATSGVSTYPYIVKMNTTQSLAIFAPASTFMNACVITVSGGLVTMGFPYVLNAAASTYPTVCRLTDTTAVVCWVAGAAIQSMVLTISGESIVFNASQLVYTGASTYLSVVRMTDTQALLTYANSSSFLSAVVLDLAGTGTATTVTVGTINVINALATTYIAAASISATQAVVVLRNTSTFAKTNVLTVTTGSPSTVAAGALSAASGAAAVSYCAITAISATKVIIAYVGVSSYAEAVVGTVSGTNCAFGTVKPLNATVSTFVAISALDTTTAIVTLRPNNTFLSAIHLTENAAAITIGSLVQIGTSAITSNYSVAALSATLAISTFIAAPTFVQMRLIDISGTTPSSIADSTTGGTTLSLANGGGSSVAVNDYAFGTGIAGNAKVQSINGDVVTLDTAHTALVTGFVRFNQLPNATVANAEVGFPLKVKLVTKLPNFTAINSLYLFTSNTPTSRGYTYPTDVIVVSVILQNVVAQSTYRIETTNAPAGTMIFEGINSGPGTTITNSYTHTGTDIPVKIIVRKSSGIVKYLPFETLGTITNTGMLTYVSQVSDSTTANTTSGPINNDWTINYGDKRIYHVQYKDVINGSDASIAEITDVTVLPTSGITAGDYFNLYSAKDATAYYVWYQIDSVGTNPVPAGMTEILVDIATGDANTAVATKTRDAINSIAGADFTATASSAIVTITNDAKGSTTDASDSTGGTITGFTFTVTTQGKGKTIWSTNALYTWVQDEFDATSSLDDLVPMSAQTPTEYSLINGWFIDEESIKFLNDGALQTSGWASSNAIRISSYTQTVEFVATDIGRTIVGTNRNGKILFFDTVRAKVWVRPTAGTDTFPAGAYTVTDSTAAGSVTGTSLNGENMWSNIFTLGSLVTGTTLDIYQNDVQITPWWTAGHIDVLIKVKEGGVEIDSGNVTVLARKYSTLYDHFVIDATSGRNPVPLAAFVDSNNTTVVGTVGVAPYTNITFDFGAISRDLGNGNGFKPYDVEIDCAGLTLVKVYEYLKYVTRTGSAFTFTGYGTIPGEFYTAVGDIRFNYDSEGGGGTIFDESVGELITGTGGGSPTGYLVSLIDNTSPANSGTMVLRNVHGTFTNNQVITGATSGRTAQVNGTPESITPSKQAPFGTFAGGAFFGARGVWITNMAVADANSFELIDSEGTLRIPSEIVNLTINIADAEGNTITENCEVTVVKTSDDSVLFHEDDIVDGTTIYDCTATAGTVTYINVLNVAGYQPRTVNNFTLPTTSGTLNIQLDEDRFYSNP